MRSCSAASLEIPYAHLLNGDAMSLHPLKIENRKQKIENNNGIGRLFLFSIFWFVILFGPFRMIESIGRHVGDLMEVHEHVPNSGRLFQGRAGEGLLIF